MRKLTEPQVIKRCPRCGKDKPVSEFYARTDRPGQYVAFCKACDKARVTAAYRVKHNVTPRDPLRKPCSRCGVVFPREEFPPAGQAKGKRRPYCRSCHRELRAAYRAAHPDVETASDARYRERHREMLKERSRRWYYEHPERFREIAAKTQEKHRDKRRIYNRAYCRAHAEQYRAYAHARRARIIASGGNYTVEEWHALKAHYGNRCLRCGLAEGALHPNGKPVMLTPDHVVPIARGGANTVDNLQPLCRHCNSVKNRRIQDFREEPH